MTHRQEDHLNRIKTMFLAQVDVKYRAGAGEHNSNLMDADPLWLINEAMNECIDKYTYLFTLREKLLCNDR